MIEKRRLSASKIYDKIRENRKRTLSDFEIYGRVNDKTIPALRVINVMSVTTKKGYVN